MKIEKDEAVSVLEEEMQRICERCSDADDGECEDDCITLAAFNLAAKRIRQCEDIVHCGECRHWVPYCAKMPEDVKFCDIAGWLIGENGYCRYGEGEEKK